MREKYISPEEAVNSEIVYISGKHAEEVGLEKLAKRQAQLQGIHTLVLDRMCIRHRESDHEADQSVSSLCANITSLDLGGNLFESWDEVVLICRLFPRLSSLTLDGNRFHNIQNTDSDFKLPNIRYLGLADTILSTDDIALVTATFPSLQTLILANNELESWNTNSGTSGLPETIHSLDLSGNQFKALNSLKSLLTLPVLLALILKTNKIDSPIQPSTSATTPTILSQTLKTLDLRSNQITTWALPTSLPTYFPALQNLLIAPNPLYTTLTSFEDNKPLTPSDGYILTLARLPQLQTLNHSTITDEQRLNADTYYLKQIVWEIEAAPRDQHGAILASHPRWQDLCKDFGTPLVDSAPRREKGEIDPSTLAARFVAVTFYLEDGLRDALCDEALYFGEHEWIVDVPRSASVYALHGRVGKDMEGVLPLNLKLVWETGERDPVRMGGDGSEAPEWWDSSDEEDRDGEGEWVAREVELVAGTRMVGSYFEGREARVRVEARWPV